MKTTDFRVYLGRMGKKEHVVEGLLTLAVQAEAALKKDLDRFTLSDLEGYLQMFETAHPGHGKKAARALALYFAMTGNVKLKSAASGFRESAMAKTRAAFLLKDFQGIDPGHIERLRTQGIVNTTQLLTCTRTRKDRRVLARRTGIPYPAILELVKLSDLSRIPGVKQVRARLYYDAGIDTVEKMAACEPEALVGRIREFAAQTGFSGVPTLPREARSTIATARQLPVQIEYSRGE